MKPNLAIGTFGMRFTAKQNQWQPYQWRIICSAGEDIKFKSFLSGPEHRINLS